MAEWQRASMGGGSTRQDDSAPSTNTGRRLHLLHAAFEIEATGLPGAGVAAVADATGRERSQVSRGLALLAEASLLTRDENTLEYSAGPALLRMAAAAGRPELLRVARPLLINLAAEIGERSTLEVPWGTESLVVDTVSSAEPVEAVAWVGRTSPRWCTASGRASLFDLDDDSIETSLGVVEFEAGPQAPASIPEVLDRLSEDRRRGVSVAVGELEEGLVSVSAPIRDPGGVVAVIAVSGPIYRLGDKVAAVVDAVRTAAERITADLADTTTHPEGR